MGRKERGLKAYKTGLRAETFAALWLMAKGYRVIARREKTKAGEIDLVARRGHVVVFIEVKARADVESAAMALGAMQRERLMRAASLFLAQRPSLQAHDIRFDMMLIAPNRWPCHISDAWQA